MEFAIIGDNEKLMMCN